MRLTIIGSSPAWPNPGGCHSGYLVDSTDGGRLLIECGPGVLSRLRARGELDVDAIVISHMHLDHWGDLVPWAWVTLHGGSTETPAELVLPPGGHDDLTAFAARWGSPGMFERAFALREFASRERFDAAGFEIEAIPVEHFGGTAHGLRVRDAGGTVLAFSGDTAPCEGVREIAAGADLFLCEATLTSPDRDGTPRGHMTIDEAVEYVTGDALFTHCPVELELPAGLRRAEEGLVVEFG